MVLEAPTGQEERGRCWRPGLLSLVSMCPWEGASLLGLMFSSTDRGTNSNLLALLGQWCPGKRYPPGHSSICLGSQKAGAKQTGTKCPVMSCRYAPHPHRNTDEELKHGACTIFANVVPAQLTVLHLRLLNASFSERPSLTTLLK